MLIQLTEQEKREVTLLCFAETIMQQLKSQQKEHTRRHTQLTKAIERIQAVDETYHGYLPDEYQHEAEKMLYAIEQKLIELFGEVDYEV